MLKKFGTISLIAGITCLFMGIWAIDSSGPFSYIGYSSGTRTIMEIAPFFFIGLGCLGLLGGIVYLYQDAKPLKINQGKIIEKNGNLITVEFKDGTRKVLTLIGSLVLTIGDKGLVSSKGNFIVDFKKK